MPTLDDILGKVTAEKTVEESLETLCSGISQQLKDLQATVDPAAAAKIQAISDAIDANIAEVQAAVTANTPAAPVA